VNSNWLVRLSLFGVLVVAYFVLFPDDLAALIGPLEQLLRLSQAVSPWLYALIGVALLCWTLDRIWGKGARREVPPT
jgi:hypothetical protein